jgi:hypothetical protein
MRSPTPRSTSPLMNRGFVGGTVIDVDGARVAAAVIAS